jgi:hypothetical protein
LPQGWGPPIRTYDTGSITGSEEEDRPVRRRIVDEGGDEE